MDLRSKQIDIVVYVALSEEFTYIKEELGSAFEPVEITDIAITCFFGQIQSDISNYNFNVVVVPAGKMGIARASNVMSTILDRFKPSDVVVLGIAGSLSNDLQPGDVFIPDRVNEYLANSATYGDKGWMFQTSGNHFITAPRLINRFQMIASTQKRSYNKWLRATKKNSSQLIDASTRELLQVAGLEIRSECKLHVGDDKALASGPAVGKGKAFVDWIRKEVDRKIVAMEMESAGVYDAALIRTPAPRAIAIRGISDFADERKEKLETAAKDRFRTLAVKNAVSLLLNAIQGGLFKKDVNPALEEVVLPPLETTSVVAPAGRLLITLTRASSGWSLFAENKSDRQLTSITITLRPPATLFMSNSDTLIQIPRLPAGGRSAAKALTLRAGSRSSSAQPRRDSIPASRRAILSKKDFAEDRRSQVESLIKQVRSSINNLEKEQMASLGGIIKQNLGLQIDQQREVLSKFQQEIQELDAELADYEERLMTPEQVSVTPDIAHQQPEIVVSLAFSASYRVEGSSSERVEGVLPVSLA
ncbi:MAG: hypothetical protein ACJ8CR_26875 [Roseiflexaceae bacterium]